VSGPDHCQRSLKLRGNFLFSSPVVHITASGRANRSEGASTDAFEGNKDDGPAETRVDPPGDSDSLDRARASKLRGRSRRQEPQESSPLSPTSHEVDSKAGAGQALRDPEDQAKGASPGPRSRGEWTVTARWPGAGDATPALPTGRFVVRSPKEHARRSGRPDGWGRNPDP
jgi:hypothetical protein